MPWYSHHYSQRPILSSDRLPHLNLPQSYAASSAYGSTAPRSGPPEPSSSGSYSSSQGALSSHQGTGFRTPSTSPTAQHISHPESIGLSEEPTEGADYSSQHSSLSYSQAVEPYSGAMNQPPQYMDSHQSYSSGGQSYASQPTASQYPQYPHQPAALQPGPGSYTPSPTYGQQYGYPNGITSPQGSGHSVPQMNAGMLPLPSKSWKPLCIICS